MKKGIFCRIQPVAETHRNMCTCAYYVTTGSAVATNRQINDNKWKNVCLSGFSYWYLRVWCGKEVSPKKKQLLVLGHLMLPRASLGFLNTEYIELMLNFRLSLLLSRNLFQINWFVSRILFIYLLIPGVADMRLTNKILTVACGMLGAGFLLSTLLLCIAKANQT